MLAQRSLSDLWHGLMAVLPDRPLAAVACNLDLPLLQATFPLFQAGEVEAIEWAIDVHSLRGSIPDWFEVLLESYGENNRLLAHGIYYSLLSGDWKPEQAAWLREVERLCKRFQPVHVSEHFGFVSGADFHKGAPLPVPLTQESLAVARDRLMRLSVAAGRPVGLENLAFAPHREAAVEQAAFLRSLLEPINGFLLLDLHNLYCQAHNFRVPADELLAAMPLERVREIHVSGGSWDPHPAAPSGRVRRDTHDEKVPEEVWNLLKTTVPRCPNLKFVVLEQMGSALTEVSQQFQFREDYRRMKSELQQVETRGNAHNDFAAPPLKLYGIPLESSELASEQRHLSEVLENSPSLEASRALLEKPNPSLHDWKTGIWPDHMLETARKIAQKWKHGF